MRIRALVLAAAVAVVTGGGAAAQATLAYTDAARLYGAVFVEARRRADYLVARLMDQGITLGQYEAREAVAVAFPELLRYASLRDRLETAALETLYVKNGKGDFSIGPLQMKPSFAQRVEEWAARLPRAAAILGITESLNAESPNAESGRRARINRLRSMGGQAPYLAAFYLVALAHFPELATLAGRDRVAFLAAAYNAGFHKERERIESAMALAIFPPPPGWPDPLSYVELSLGYFESQNP
ncbi:MAG: hypothetical protein Q8M76_19290 [Spirochaetaceae bacterium]|nr:hypothetical protein [Spirochaetaceae bacterium]